MNSQVKIALGVIFSAVPSKRALALKLGMSPSYMTHLANERREPTYDVLEALARAAGFTLVIKLRPAGRSAKKPAEKKPGRGSRTPGRGSAPAPR